MKVYTFVAWVDHVASCNSIWADVGALEDLGGGGR